VFFHPATTMVKIRVDKEDQIVITLDSKEMFLAVKRKLAIPKENLVSISTEKAKLSWLSFKMGTHMPNGFMAGTF
jgi:hypothetical protein